LIGASNSSFAKSKEARNAARSFTNRPVSYANVVQGANGGEHYGRLKGWRYRACGSWDIYAAIFRDALGSTSLASMEKGHEQEMPLKTSGKDAKSQNPSVSPRNDDCIRMCSPPCSKDIRERRLVHTSTKSVGTSSLSGNQLQALRDL